MAHYHAISRSRRPAPETFDHLATFSNSPEWDPGVLAGQQLDPVDPGPPLRLLHPLLRRGFRAVGDRAATGLARTLSAAPAPHRQPGS